MGIISLISETENLIKTYQYQTLKGCPDSLVKEYEESQSKTEKISEILLPSDREETLSENESSLLEDKHVKPYDLLIKEGEDLSLIIKINEQTQKLMPSNLEEQLDKVTKYLIDEICINEKYNIYILNNIKKNKNLYINLINHFIYLKQELFISKLNLFLTKNYELNQEIGQILLQQFIYKPNENSEKAINALSENFEYFCVKDENFRKEFACAIAKNNLGAKNLAANIEKFSFGDESFREEIALAIAVQELGAYELASNIKEFSFGDESFRKEIALAITVHELGAYELASNIEKFSFDDEAFRKEIALTVAKYNWGARSLASNIEKFSIGDEDSRKEIALAIAEHMLGAESLAVNIEKFSIEDEDFRKEIALGIAEHALGAESLAANIEKFFIEDRDSRKEIALAIAKHDLGAGSLAENIEKFSIVDEDFGEIIAHAIAEHPLGAKNLAGNFENFSIKGEASQKKIALAIAEHMLGAEKLAANIDKFSMDDEAFRKEIALAIAKFGWSAKKLVANIDKFFIKDEDSRKEIALAIAEHALGAKRLAANIERLSIEDEESRKEIAFAIVKHVLGAESLAVNIEKFSFKEEVSRKEIALAIARHALGARSLVENIEKFFIEDEDSRKEIALAIAEHALGAKRLAASFKKFSIKDKTSRKKIILAIAKHILGTRELVENIGNFANEEDFQKEMVFLIAECRWGAVILTENIEKLPLDDESFQKEIARSIVKNGRGAGCLAANIERFSIDDEAFRNEIVRAIAKHDLGAKELAANIEKFSIEDENFLKEIARAIAKHDLGAGSLAANIEKFPIEDEDFRKEIALAIANHIQGAKELAENIEKFSFEDEAFRKEIALAIFKHKNGSKYLLENLKKFAFEEDQRFQKGINKIVGFNEFSFLTQEEFKKLMISPVACFGFFDHFFENILQLAETLNKDDFDDIREKYTVDVTTLRSNFSFFKEKSADFENKKVKPSDIQTGKQLCIKLFNQFSKDKKTKVAAKQIAVIKTQAEFLAPIYFCVDKIASEEDPNLQKKLARWMFYSLFILLYLKKDIDRNCPFDSEILKLIYNVRDQDLKYHLIDRFAHQLKSNTLNKEDLAPSYLALSKLLVNELKASRKEVNGKAFIMSLKKKRKFLRDGEIQIQVYQALKNLNASQASFELVNTMLIHFSRLNDKELLGELNALNAVLLLNKENELKIDPLNQEDRLQIIDHLRRVFYEFLPGLALSNLQSFQERFFGRREPGALAVYVAGLSRLPERDSEAVLETVKMFLQEVDSDSFHKSRYEDSEHLEKVFKERADLKEKWMAGKKAKLAPFLTEVELEDPKKKVLEIVKKSIFTDHHLSLEWLPKTAQFFDPSVKVKGLEAAQEFDEHLYQLVNDPEIFSVEYLERMEILLHGFASGSEFFNDIKDLKNMLTPKIDKHIEKWTIEDSDDPSDLFLSGTEVGGSCQRVDGDPKLNKALMGYVMDGKHRILAIKDAEGKIVGRLIFRVLYDEVNDKPVLFFERIYPKSLPAKYQAALKKFALARAQDLGVDLISKETESEHRYPGNAVSYGSRAPFVYCDAVRGIRTEGYVIDNCYQMNTK